MLDYGSQILEGLQFIHDEGIIHRDITPHNILVTDTDTTKISDFGTALQEVEEIFDNPGLKVGSPYYIAPEQSRNPENAVQRSDLYSVAVMLYRMLTGELPTIKNIKLSRVNTIYDNSWDSFFCMALERNPARRFQNAHEMAATLSELKLHLGRKIDSTCRTISSENQKASGTAGGEVRKLPLRVAGINARKAFRVNELLTLVHDPRLPESSCPNDVWQQQNLWYLSCDRRSEKTSRYVNTCLGYTGWQENNCRNHVLSVASLPRN